MNTTPATDDPIRDLMRRAVAGTPATPSFDTALARAARLGVTADEAYVATAHERASRRSIRGFLAGLLALLTVGGGYFAYATFIGPDGYDTPTEAAEGFIDALSSGDLLRAGRALVPFEREHMDVRLANVLSLATDGGALEANDLAHAKHISLSPQGLKWRERPMVAGVTRVEVVEGHLWLEFEPGLFGGRFAAAESSRVDLVDLLRPAEDGRSRPASFVVLNRGGNWYVSLSYSVFDTAVGPRRDGVDLRAAVSAKGSDTPEAAATATFLAMNNQSGVSPELLDQIDPESGEAFLRYLPRLADEEASAFVRTRAPRWRIEGDGHRRSARLLSAEFDPEGDGSFARTDPQSCDDAPSAECSYLLARSIPLVERDGRWYVDPIEGAGHLLMDLLVGEVVEERSVAASDAPPIGPPISLEAGVAPPPDLMEALAPCLAQAQTHPNPDAEVLPPGAGAEFPKGFWWCMDQMSIDYEFSW